jgi:slit protein 2
MTSFKGCMKEVWINHKQADFFNAARQQKVNPGCALLDSENEGEMEDQFIQEPPEDESKEEVSFCKVFLEIKKLNFFLFQQLDPCDKHQCKRGGKCIPNNKGSYSCKCPKGSRGKYCEQGETASIMSSQKMVEEFDEPFDKATNGIMLLFHFNPKL